MPDSARLVISSVGLIVLSLLLVACAEVTAARDDLGLVSKEYMSGQIPTEMVGMQPTTMTTLPPQSAAAIPDLGPAPEITNEVWINAPESLTLEALRGKVVLVEFWTYG